MPKNPNIKKVLVIGSGPIVIGQAAEFDYAGTQACRAYPSQAFRLSPAWVRPIGAPSPPVPPSGSERVQ